MNTERIGLLAWSRTSAIVGGIVWLVSLGVSLRGGGERRAIEALFLLAVLVVTPLALQLVATPDRTGRYSRPYRAAVIVQPLGAALAVGSFLLPAGVLAAIVAAGWALVTGLVGLFGLVRLLPRGLMPADEACIDAGLLYLPIGGIWLILSRLGTKPFGFQEPIVLLTAVHFHYSGFAAPVLTGLAGRKLAESPPSWRTAFSLVAAGVIVGPALVAAGITLSPLLEVIAAVILAAGLLGLAHLNIFIVARAITLRLARGLLVVSSLSVVLGMLLALLYALGQAGGVPAVTIPQMVLVHGTVNALGFVLTGLLAWAMIRPQSHLPPPGIPFSLLRSRGRVGPDFFHRLGVVTHLRAPPLGLVDDLAEYQRPDFDPHGVHPSIRAFYEQTSHYSLLVRPAWQLRFRSTARLFKHFSSWVGQMNLPLSAERREELIDSQIVPIDDSHDGRTNVRGWIRTYTRTGEAVYVAAYANHSMSAQTYMNIAFPLPGGNLTSILRLELLETGRGLNGVLLTTLPGPNGRGDEGVYFANPLLPIRLPLNETIRVRPAAPPGLPSGSAEGTWAVAPIIARHDMWLFGIKFLTLDYAIFFQEGSDAADGLHPPNRTA